MKPDEIFEGSFKGVGEMLRSKFMQAAMHRRAILGKAYAITISPTSDAEDRRAGDDKPKYRDCFKTSSGLEVAGAGPQTGTARAYGELENDAPHAADVEFGRGGNRARAGPGGHHVLIKSLDVMGGKI